jgi:hypothetical protein
LVKKGHPYTISYGLRPKIWGILQIQIRAIGSREAMGDESPVTIFEGVFFENVIFKKPFLKSGTSRCGADGIVSPEP